jgi:uncharacterized membrane protein
VVDARVLHRLLLLSVIVGLGFSAYAAFEVLQPPLQGACTINSYLSCSAVDRSGWTTIGPVPDWAVGVGGFALMLAIDVVLIRTYDPRWLNALLAVALVGLAVAAGLAYVELAIVRALCPICLGAYLSDGAVVGLVLQIRAIRRAPVAEIPAGPEDAPAR